MLVVEVVPTVATTAIGSRPAARSAAIAWASAGTDIRNSPSLSIRRTFSWPTPRTIADLSIEEWAWSLA